MNICFSKSEANTQISNKIEVYYKLYYHGTPIRQSSSTIQHFKMLKAIPFQN